MNRRMKPDAAALTLMETLISIGIINMILLMSGVCFAEIIRLRGAQNRYNERLLKADYLLRRVERDVRSARAFPASVGQVRAGEKSLILKTAGGEVLYRVENDKVRRTEHKGGRSRDEVIVEKPGLDIRFDFDGSSPDVSRSVVTTVAWDEHPKIGISRPTLSLRVALRHRR